MQSQIIFVTIAATLLQGGYSGFVSIQMPYLNPAGVTYINNVQPQTHHLYGVPARVETEHVGYAAAQVPAVAAVPYIKHVPTVSHVPVTKIEAQHAFLEKQLDVVKPAVSTRKFEVRRPAIQKQFYDIEERVVVRPAGSAVVELDQPTSKTQKGPAVIQSLFPQYENGPTASPPTISSTPAPSDDESVVVENPDFRNRASQVGFGNLGFAKSAIGDAGQVRGRVISATPAPDYADAADERVSTRRVVVSRPIETLQELNVVEPATKIERVSVHQPTLIKTARLDHVQVHGSVPVVGKAYAPTIAHAAVPVYQKTISPAYQYYH